MFFAEKRTTVYEVREGSILKDNSYTGLILRDETVVYTEQGGYVNYFYESGKKVPVGRNVYLVTEKEVLGESNEETNEEVVLKSENWNSLLMKVQSFNDTFQKLDFDSVKSLKDETNAILNSNTTQNRVTQLNTIISSTQMPYTSYLSADDGIIAYSIDGYEELTIDGLSEKELSKKNYKKITLTNNTEVKSGDPVYRLITDEEWELIIPLSEEMKAMFLEQMGEKEYLYVKLKVLKDKETLGGYLRIQNDAENNVIGVISLSDSLVRYVEERYLDVELIMENESGLKIPKSSVVEKEFYLVPEAYLTQGGSSSASGFYVENKKDDSITFKETDVFKRDVENGMLYLKTDTFESGTVIVKPESSERFVINKTTLLSGVYNVNKGYAVFTQVNILCESEAYYIIEEGMSRGLSNYDHIALDGSSVKDNQIISQ